MTEEEIFHQALSFKLPEERAEFLDRMCAGNPPLRASIEALLRANVGASGFMDKPTASLASAMDDPVGGQAGTMIGPYKLLEQIGEGGFGVVFMAEQTEPVRRKVALKILKPGMDSRQVVARFEAERQALAIMDHPNIAKVFDGGMTNETRNGTTHPEPFPLRTGRPFFVMELVKGVPITEFCDLNQLSPRRRLELFIPVCHAVQHAHQKGIIHRDLKPSNILVTIHDTVPVVKVIDFGVAKAIGQELTDKTLFTGFAQMIGTPLYMSPEQAGQSGLDIDTRSDIYSLGVLLYELLTGTTPFEKERFKRAAYDEIRRIICEEEPPKPSTRLSNLGKSRAAGSIPATPKSSQFSESPSSLASVSATRQTEPGKLMKLIRGELDWIVMKCLDKDRNRRYETANAFAADLQRYLSDEAVQACPPSTAYRLQKFIRRNRGAILATTGVFLALLAGLIAAGWSLSVARSERNAKTLAFEQADANFRQARDAVDQFLTSVGDSPDLKTRGLEPLRAQLLAKAKAFYETFAREHADNKALLADLALSHYRLAEIEYRMGNLAAAEPLYEQARERFASLEQSQPNNPENRNRLASVLNDVALVYKSTNRRQLAESTWQKALALRTQLRADSITRPDFASAVADTEMNLGLLHHEDGRFDDATTEYQNALTIYEDSLRSTPDDAKAVHKLAASHFNLGKLYLERKQFEKAQPDVEQAIEGWTKATNHDPAEPDYADNLARAYINRGVYFSNTKRRAEAASDWSHALQTLEKLTREHPYVPVYLMNLATVCSNLSTLEMAAHKQDDSIRHLRMATEANERLLQNNPNDLNYAVALGGSQINLSSHFMEMNQWEPALASCDKALLTLSEAARKNPKMIGVTDGLRKAHTNRSGALSRLGRHDAALDAIEQAAKYDTAKSYVLAINRAVVLARRGDHAKAAALADELIKALPKTDHNDRCVLAGVYANASAAAAKDAVLPEPERIEKSRANANRALQLLRDALAGGFFNDPANIQELKTNEADMAPLRELPEFKELVRKAEAKVSK